MATRQQKHQTIEKYCHQRFGYMTGRQTYVRLLYLTSLTYSQSAAIPGKRSPVPNGTFGRVMLIPNLHKALFISGNATRHSSIGNFCLSDA